MSEMISTRALHVGPPEAPRLNGITASWPKGLNILLGPNGAGKSTLIRILATLSDSEWHGEVNVLGFDPNSAAGRKMIRKLIGYVPQTMSFPFRLSLGDFLEYLALARGLSRNESVHRVKSVLDIVGLGEHESKQLGHLSGGMLQRANIAQALLIDPQVLLLDEPTAGLDWEAIGQLHEVLQIVRHDRIVIMATHLRGDLELDADQITRIRNGIVDFHGSSNNFLKHEEVGE